jgi:uncharacterized protein (DUF983 family)
MNISVEKPLDRPLGDVVVEKREVWPALKRGMRKLCPACGKGHIFYRYLKVSDACPHCGEEFFHHRADDMPPYVTMLIAGHFVVGGLMAAQEFWPDFPDWGHMIVWPLVTLLLCLWLLPIVKGALIAYQWALRMHGFDKTAPEELP